MAVETVDAHSGKSVAGLAEVPRIVIVYRLGISAPDGMAVEAARQSELAAANAQTQGLVALALEFIAVEAAHVFNVGDASLALATRRLGHGHPFAGRCRHRQQPQEKPNTKPKRHGYSPSPIWM